MTHFNFLINSLYVGAGGFLGAILRYTLTLMATKHLSGLFPYGTLLVNTLGGLLIGLLMALSLASSWFSQPLKLFLITGLLGGLTTFSTFSHETLVLFGSGHWFLALINIFFNIFLALLGVLMGRMLFLLF